MEGNAKGNSSTFINLQGTLSGNPSTNNELDSQYYIPFLAEHALVSIRDYDYAAHECHHDWVHNNSPKCVAAKQDIFDRITTRINPYNVYALCEGPGPSAPGYCFTHNTMFGAPSSQTFIPCINTTLTDNYLNDPSVQEAIFVKSVEWDICSQILNYTVNYNDMIPFYNQLVQQYRVLIYSGDVDSCVNYLGTERAAGLINATGEAEAWQAWMVDDQVAGYKLIFGTNLTYITIKEAGHMVPTYKPAQALAFFSRFIQGKPI